MDLPKTEGWATVTDVIETATGWRVYADSDDEGTVRRDLTSEQAAGIQVISEDGSADSVCVLAGLWAEWMQASTSSATALATTPLRPYAHQANAVYGAMLPQPRSGSSWPERSGDGQDHHGRDCTCGRCSDWDWSNRALIVVPAHLATKWQADFERFFGGGLKRITSDTVRARPAAARSGTCGSLVGTGGDEPERPGRDPARPAGWDVAVIRRGSSLDADGASVVPPGWADASYGRRGR